MEIFSNLALGFDRALQPDALLFCMLGVTVGTFVGVLPGLGAMVAISLALPLTYYLDPAVALIMLSGIFYGAQYGSSTAAILLNVPGTATAAATCLDGYPLSQQGKAGIALFITTICSFLGGTFGIVMLSAFAPLIADVALRFGSAEYFAIMLLGLVAASSLSIGSPLKGLAMVVVGVALGLVGIDVNTGQFRFTYGNHNVYDGLGLVAVAMGLFGVGEIIYSIGRNENKPPSTKVSFREMIPSRREARAAVMPTARGSLVGFVMGALPGAGPSIAAFMSYALEKKVAKDPSRFGKGAIEGIAAPEAANNAAVQSAFIPTLSLGIPGDVVMAVLLGALLIHGITPGPAFISGQPEIFWGLIASFWIGNVLLLILNIPLIGIWVRILTIPYKILYPSILFFVCIGMFSVRNNIFDVYIVAAFGIVGYLMRVFNYPAAPLLLGFILGPLMEEHLRRTLRLSQGDFSVFIERPISLSILMVTVGIIVVAIITSIRARRNRRSSPPQEL
jgi:putative tricarboxylic transport membrane protein